MDQDKIRKQAKKIMDDFMKVIGSVRESDNFVERKEFLRDKLEKEDVEEFVEFWFKIIPKKKERFLQAEKRHWK